MLESSFYYSTTTTRRRSVSLVALFVCAVSVTLLDWKTVIQLPSWALSSASSSGSRIKSTSSTTDGSIDLPTVSNEKVASCQEQAMAVLRRMEERDAMTTKFSSRDYALRHGFQRLWEPCVLERLVQQQKLAQQQQQQQHDRVEVVILGGSSSSRPGRKCTARAASGITPGRYSNLLEQRLIADEASSSQSLFRIINRAQGSESSSTNALLLDELVDPLTTDIIVWEFLINDQYQGLGGGPTEQVRKLDFWFTRVKALFDQRGRPPPAIMLLYLWGKSAGARIREHKATTIDSNPLAYTGPLIDSYRELGWDIAVVNVGAAVNSTALLPDYTLLFDDGHHPGCEGTNFIADMLQHALFSNLAEECHSMGVNNATLMQQRTQPQIPPHKTVRGQLGQQWEPLWDDLFREDAVAGSITGWKPRLSSNTSNLHIENLEVWAWPFQMLAGKADVNREDRKYVFVLKPCGARSLNITLRDPDLKWLGLSLTADDENTVHVSVNDAPVQVAKPDISWNFAMVYINHWIRIGDNNITRRGAHEYRISLCNSNPTGKSFFHHLVGVSVPTNDNRR